MNFMKAKKYDAKGADNNTNDNTNDNTDNELSDPEMLIIQ